MNTRARTHWVIRRHVDGPRSRHLALCAGLFSLLLGLSGCGMLREPPRTPQPAPTLVVNADDAARAMLEDHFYSDYDPYTLVLHGQVTAIDTPDSGAVVHLDTSLETKVLCELGKDALAPQVGQTITVSAPGAYAERQPSAVLLKNCKIG